MKKGSFTDLNNDFSSLGGWVESQNYVGKLFPQIKTEPLCVCVKGCN